MTRTPGNDPSGRSPGKADISKQAQDMVSDNAGPRVAIAMRSYKNIEIIRGTLEMVAAQAYRNVTLWNFDSSFRDWTLDVTLPITQKWGCWRSLLKGRREYGKA
jgi:hypothetical protein